MIVVERLQHKHTAARQQRSRQLEARVLGRRPDQRDDAVLDPRQKCVLLRLVEAVDLVAEQDRPLPLILEPLLRLLDDLADATHALRDRREGLEVPVGIVRDDPGEGGFAGAGRAPEDARPDVATPNQIAEGFARAEEMLLTEKLLQCLRPHPRGEGFGGSLKQRRLGHDAPSMSILVTKNTAAPAKNADGSAQPFLP